MTRRVEHFEDARILVVDDEEMNLRLLRRILERDGYRCVRTTSSGATIEDLIEEFDPHLVVLDLHMPVRGGLEILQLLASRINGPGLLPVLVLTGDDTPNAKRSALSLGARDFLAKPFDATEALLRIRNLLETKFLYSELETQNSRLEIRVVERTHELELSQMEVLERLARTSEIRDDETGRHTKRVGELAASIGEAAGLPSEVVELIRITAPLHDLGKIGIPDCILLKPGKLCDEERAIMRTHTTIGARILSGGNSQLMKTAERIALSHHECWDGSGYPNRIAGEAIPVEARIVALADCVDALTHNRPYRSAWPLDKVLAEVERSSGIHFDPSMVRALIDTDCFRRIVASPPRPFPALTIDPDMM